MQDKNESTSPLYTTNVVEFVTVANEFCCQLEQCRNSKRQEFMERMSKIAPLLYLKTALLPDLISNLSDEIESFVTEEEYEQVRQNLAHLFGEMDNYLDTQVADMQYSEEPLPASISENLADVYQDLKDMIMNFNSANSSIMLEAVIYCKDNFKNIWGQKLISALGALHNALYAPSSDFTTNGTEESHDDQDF